MYGGFVYITFYEILMLVNLYTHVYTCSKDIFRMICAVDFLFSTSHRSTTPFLYGKINFRSLNFLYHPLQRYMYS